MHTKLKQLVEHFGSQSELARKLGISRQAVAQWTNRIPLGRAYQIQVLTAGRFQATDFIEAD